MKDPVLADKPARIHRAHPRYRWHAEAGTAAAPAHSVRPFWREHGPIVAIAIAALGLRLFALSRRLIVFDESLVYRVDLIGLGLSAYVKQIWSNTTYNPGWAILVWVMHRLFGFSTFWMRVPSALVSAAATISLYASARAIGLSRRAGLMAGTIMAVAIFQIEYGQQILPHAVLPLGAGLCLWLVTLLARPETWEQPQKMTACVCGLITIFGVLILAHNAALLLLPSLFLFLGWGMVRPRPRPAALPGGSRQLAILCGTTCALAVSFASAAWVFAKLGESDRDYLRPYFVSTFRQTPDRALASPMLNMFDRTFGTIRPAIGEGWRGRAFDVAYFVGTRTYDFVYGGFKVLGEQQATGAWYDQALPAIMVGVFLCGVVHSLRGGGGVPLRRWVSCLFATVGLTVVLGSLHIYPLGGIRHLIGFSPLVILTAAAAIDSRSRWVSRVALGACLLWIAGDVALLPKYYRTTSDTVGGPTLQRIAWRYGVHDFVAGDGLCSEGAIRTLLAPYPSLRMVPADFPRLAELTQTHRPFFLCSLHNPLFKRPGDALTPTDLLVSTMHPLANLRHYRATPLLAPPRPIPWLDWTVYLLTPEPGPYPPEVVSVTALRGFENRSFSGFTARFSQPMRAETINVRSVNLVKRSPSGEWEQRPATVLNVVYDAPSRTVMILPREPLPMGEYFLTLHPTILDEQGRPLDVKGRAFHQVFGKRIETMVYRKQATDEP